MRVIVALLAGVALAGCACGNVHAREDGGTDAGPPADVPRPDAPRDGGLDGASCPRVTGLRACGEWCPVMCSREDGPCSYEVGLCGLGGFGACSFNYEVGFYCASSAEGPFCATGTIGDFGDRDDPLRGTCVTEALCAAIPTAGLGGFDGCTYSDGTRFVDGPPEVATCPAEVNPRAAFCGGPCGMPCELEPVLNLGGCVGLSEDRGTGFCFRGINCLQDLPDRVRNFARIFLDERHGESTLCVVPRPQPTGVPEFGWAAPRSVCIAYAALHPGHAECRDADWNLVP